VAAVTGERGTTLVELLVVTALLGTVAVLGAQLVIQSARLVDTVARSSRNPDLVLATEWLRRDLYEASWVVGGELGWTSDPLLVSRQGGGWVAVAVVGGELVRTAAPPGGLVPDSRVLLRGVTAWRWRLDDGVLVRVELEGLANPEAHRNLTGAASHRLERRTETLALALRGRPGGRAW
jgi:type II secretory pathway pseudopilin PulG